MQVPTVSQATSTFLRYGDVVGFCNDSYGFMGVPSAQDEPIPERSSNVSHCQIVEVESNDGAFPSDYCGRCMFRLARDKSADSRAGEILFGSIVRLTHEPTGYALVAHLEAIDDEAYNKRTRKGSVFLRADASSDEETASQWVLLSRFKLRKEGDPVRIEDHIVLKSVAYKDFYLAVADPQQPNNARNSPRGIRTDGAGRTKPERALKRQNTLGKATMSFLGMKMYIGLSMEMSTCGWRLKRFQSIGDRLTASGEGLVGAGADSGRQVIIGGSYIRVGHIETKGKLICRIDDDRELQSRLAPLGSICRQITRKKNGTHCVFFRRQLPSQSPNANDDRRSGNDSMSIWQILPERMDQNDLLQEIKNGDSVRLRHVLSGQFLCVRPPSEGDSNVIRTVSNLNLRTRGDFDDVTDDDDDEIETVSGASSTRQRVESGSDDIPEWKGMEAPTSPRDASADPPVVPTLPIENTSPRSPSAGLEPPSLGLNKDERPISDRQGPESLSVATTDVADRATLFVIRSFDDALPAPGVGDESGSPAANFLAYHEPLYFEHAESGCQLQMNSLSTDEVDRLWWEYQGDSPVRPELSPNEVPRFNACRIEQVRADEVREALYSVRFVPLFRLAITSLQRDPSSMRLSVFEHLASGLRVLEQWVRTSIDDDASLPPIVDEEAFHPNNGAGSRRPSKTGFAEDEDNIRMQRAPSDPEFLSNNPEFSTDAKEMIMPRRGSHESNESAFASSDGGRDSPTRSRSGTISERATDILRAGKARLKIRSPRKVGEVLTHVRRPKRLSILDNKARRSIDTPLDSAGMLKLRNRQGALADCKLLEMMLHFANIVFSMVRARDMRVETLPSECSRELNREDSGLSTTELGDRFSVAPILTECCRLIYQVIAVSVAFKNRKIALRLVSIRGLLTTFILHGVHDWNPPLEALLIAANNVPSASAKESAAAREDENASKKGFAGTNMTNSKSFRKLETVEVGFSFKSQRIIDPPDIGTIVRHTCELQRKGNDNSSTLLRLLASICSPGESPDHFLQDTIIDAIFERNNSKPDFIIPSYREPGSDSGTELKPYGSASNCLFATSLSGRDTWMVNVTATGVKVSSELDEVIRDELIERVAYRNSNERRASLSSSSSITLSSVVELLTDLGYGGALLVDEIQLLTECSVGDLVMWWNTRRRDFYFLGKETALVQESSSNSSPSALPRKEISWTDHPLKRDAFSRRRTGSSSYQLRMHKNDFGLKEFDDDDDPKGTFLGFHGSDNSSKESWVGRSNPSSEDTQGQSQGQGSEDSKAADGKWEEWAVGLSVDSRNSNWLQSCLLLMNELCRGGNIRAQRHVSRYFPPELLLDLLRPEHMLNDIGKWLVCNLLRNCYVNHDFVFSSKLETSGPSTCVGLDELHLDASTISAVMGIGKVFNGSTRPHFKDCVPGTILRCHLWRFVKAEVPHMKLYRSKTDEESAMLLNVSLMQLTRELLVRGFFEDSRVFQVLVGDADKKTNDPEEKAKANVMSSMLCLPAHCFSGADKGQTGFDHSIIQETIIGKLEEAFRDHQQDKSQLKDSAMVLLSNEELARIVKRVKALGSSDVGIEHIGLITKHFDSVFTNESYAASVIEAVKLLSDLLDVAQMSLISCITTFINSSMQDFIRSNTILSRDGSMFQMNDKQEKKLRRFVSRYGAIKRIKDPLNGLRISDETALTRTLLFCSLHSDDFLKTAVYRLLYRRVSVQNDLGRILATSISLAPTALEATMTRLTEAFGRALVQYAQELVEYRDERGNVSKESNLMSVISFIMETVEATLLNPLLSTGRAESISEEKAPVVRLSSEFKLVSAVSANLRKSSIRNDLHEPRRSTSLLTKLEQREVLSDAQVTLEDWCGLQLDHFTRKLSKIDSAVHVRNVANDLLDIIGVVCTDEVTSVSGLRRMFARKGAPIKSWFKLLPRERFLVDNTMTFLAAVGSGSQQLAAEWYPKVSRLAVKYWALCDGAALMLEYLCLNCSFDEFSTMDILEHMFASLKSTSKDSAIGPVPIVARILGSILLRVDMCELKKHAISGLLNLEVCKYITRDFFEKVFEDDTHSVLSKDEALVSGKLHILRLVTLFIGSVPQSIAADISRPHFPMSLCREVLGSPHTPFLIKSCMLQISAQLYDQTKLAYGEYIAVDLARVAEVCRAIEDESEDEIAKIVEYLPSCIEYVFEGAAGALRTLFQSVTGYGDKAVQTAVASARAYYEHRAEQHRRRSISEKKKWRSHIPFDFARRSITRGRLEGAEGGAAGTSSRGDSDDGQDDLESWWELAEADDDDDADNKDKGEPSNRSSRTDTVYDAGDWHKLVDDSESEEEDEETAAAATTAAAGANKAAVSRGEGSSDKRITSKLPFRSESGKGQSRARGVTFSDERTEKTIEMVDLEGGQGDQGDQGKADARGSGSVPFGKDALEIVECAISLCSLVLSNDQHLLYSPGYSQVEDPAGEVSMNNFSRVLVVCVLAEKSVKAAAENGFDGIERTEEMQIYLDKLGKRLKYAVRAMFEWEAQKLQEIKHRKVIRAACDVAIHNVCAKSLGMSLSTGSHGDADSQSGRPAVPVLRRGITTRSISSLASFTPSLTRTDYAAFVNDLDIQPAISYEAMKETALFKVASELIDSAGVYLDNGGPKLVEIDGNIKLSTLPKSSKQLLSSALARMSDFDLWLQNGGRHLTTIVSYLSSHGTRSNEADMEVNMMLFHLLILLLESNIEEIRANTSNIRTRMARVSLEIERMQRNQGVLHAAGVTHLVARLLGGTFKLSRTELLSMSMIPIVLKLGSALFSRNAETQGEIMTICRSAIAVARRNVPPPEALTFSIVRKLFRLCTNEVEVGKKSGSAGLLDDILPLIIQLFNFCGTLCGGHNDKARDFLRNPEGETKKVVTQSIVKEASMLVNALLSIATSMITYLENEQFNEVFGPMAWDDVPRPRRRRYIAWHDKGNNFYRLARLIHVASAGFVCLTEMCQGPNSENQKIVVQATPKCPALLEFLGVLQLESYSHVRSSLIAGNFNGFKRLTWLGGHPASFYRTLSRELAQYLPEDDPELKEYLAVTHAWRPSTQQYAISGDYTEEPGVGSSMTLIGIRLGLLKEVCKLAEIKCLRMLMSMLESTQVSIAQEIDNYVDEDICMQNMDNIYRKSLKTWGRQRDFPRTTAVGYLTLISTLQSARAVESGSGEDGGAPAVDGALLDLWAQKCEKEGLNTSSLVASVEIIGADGKVQCVYFPVPAFVSLYWPYPEVQKAKEDSLYSVCRDSPEEKIADFFLKMEGIILVMRRQETLRYILTPFVHALFGGKTLSQKLSYFIPPQRLVFILLTFCLNIYYCYESVYGYDESPTRPVHDDASSYSVSASGYNATTTSSTSSSYYTLFPTFIAPFWFWNDRELFILVARYLHFGLTFSLLLRPLMNTRILDDLKDWIPREIWFKKGTVAYRVFSLFVDVIQLPRNILLLCYDSFINIIFLGCSIAGVFFDRYWFYAICLIDIVFQVRYMSFLVTAISKNVVRISFTILLAALFLYLFSVGTYLFFNSQYTLNSHINCADVGSCFKSHLDYGFNNAPDWDGDGYIEPDISGLNQNSQLGVFIARVTGTVWNLVYTILINLVLQAIVSGLIIDTFSSMRNASEEIEADIKGCCFICSIDRDTFEQAEVSFKHHIMNEHNMWKYLWFKLYLEAKDPLTFSGPEHYAYSHMMDKNSFVRLVPVKKSLSLDRKEKAASDGIPIIAVAEKIQDA